MMHVSYIPCPSSPVILNLMACMLYCVTYTVLLLFQVRLLPVPQTSVAEGGEGSFDVLLAFTLTKASLVPSE
jgi:hypothetical protein